MHFWIDKRSQCGYNGRHRVPSSLSSGRGRTRVCVAAGGARKGMAAPVHRFAAVDCPPHRPHRPHRHYNSSASHSTPAVHGQRRQESLYVEVGDAPPTIASLAAARSVTPDTLLRTAALELHDAPAITPHLKYGLLVSFSLATVFMAGVKFYFDRQITREGRSSNPNAAGSSGTPGEAAAIFGAMACVLVLGCALTRCRSRAPPALLPPDRVTSTAHRDPPPPPSESADDMTLASLLGSERPPAPRAPASTGGEAPPPYSVAVLMRAPAEPPPAYDALS